MTNFSDHITARDLLKVCNDYGVIVDAFIPYKKSKAERNLLLLLTPLMPMRGIHQVLMSLFLNRAKTNNVMSDQVLPSLILDDSCILDRDFSLSLMVSIVAKEKLLNHTGLESWFSSLKPACNSFVSDKRIVRISLERLPLKVWTRNTFAKVASKWGDLIEWEDLVEKSLFCSMYWVGAKEMEVLDPFICIYSYESESFDDEEDAEDDGSQSGDKVTTDNDVERVSESSCMPNNGLLYDNNHNNIMPNKDKVLSEDPFNLYEILKKRKDSGDDLKYPPGFTPSVINVEEINKKVKGATSNEVNKHVNSTSNKLEEFVPKGKLSSNNSVCLKRGYTSGLIL
ncbi:hypothetical protein Tco_1527928 [Tanacetum coccineum]